MSPEETLVANVRAAFVGAGAVREIKMFGGTGFMLNGNLVVAASRRGLLVRAGKDRQRDVLALPGARPMVMRGRVMEGYVYIDPPAITEASLRASLRLALAFVHTLPAKKSGKKPARAKARPK
jgi:TfoX/Sxy family transcriptional regulator of competence genes